MAGLAIAGTAFVAKQAMQTYLKLSASGSIFNASKAFYKVRGHEGTTAGKYWLAMHPCCHAVMRHPTRGRFQQE